jgi:microcystin-dependent protein
MIEGFIGMLVLYGCNFAPRGWAFCAGQLLPIAQNTALFSLLGTQYGGNGTTNFALPDLRGRVPIGQGQGSGLSNYVIGETIGAENITLLQTQIPAHNHGFKVANTSASLAAPVNNASIANYTDINGDGGQLYNSLNPATTLTAPSVGATGSNTPHSNMQPFLVMNFCIATVGIFPARN